MSLIAAASGAQNAVLDGPLLLAVVVSMAAGVISFFSPCVLPLVPGYMSYVAGLSGAETSSRESGPGTPASLVQQSAVVPLSGDEASPTSLRTVPPLDPLLKSRRERSRTLWGGMLFILGFSAVFTSYGLAFGAFGALLIDYQQVLIRVLGVVTIAMGLLFSGLLGRLPLTSRAFRPSYRPAVGLSGAPVLGVLFGLGWTPCIGPTLAAVLTLATTSAGAERGAVLSLAYSLGLGIPFLIAGASMHRVVGSFGWARRNAKWVMRAGGVFLIIIGLLQVTGAWGSILANMQGLIGGWQTPL